MELHLRLGDMVAGGNGCGKSPATRGINPRDGKLAKANTFAGSGGTGPAFKAADGVGGKVNYPLVDGVMNLNGTSVIDSLGTTFAFPATQNATTWDAIRFDIALVDGGNSPVIMQLNDQPGVDRGGIGLHTNCGVTFDLAAIRAAWGASTLRAEGVAGLNWEACTNANVEIWVLVDGALRFHKDLLIGGDHLAYSVPLTDSDRFLTLACTDYNQSDGCDHGVIADAILVIDAPGAKDCNGNHILDACELDLGLSEDCDLDLVPDACQWSFTSAGTGCAGTSGYVPSLWMDGCLAAGGTLTVAIQGGLGGATALLIVGTGAQSTPILGPGGCSLNVSGVLPFALPITLGGALPGSGNTTFYVPVPTGAASLGSFTTQAFVLDTIAPQGFSNTNAVTLDSN